MDGRPFGCVELIAAGEKHTGRCLRPGERFGVLGVSLGNGIYLGCGTDRTTCRAGLSSR